MPETYDGSISSWKKSDVYYWLENEVMLVFEVDSSSNTDVYTANQQNAMLFSLMELNQFLNMHGFHLSPFATDRMSPANVHEVTTEEQNAHFMFPSTSEQKTMAIGFFTVTPVPDTPYMQDPMAKWWTTTAGESNACKVANIINASLETLQRESKIPVIAASPHWVGGSCPITCGTTGGPGLPPSPVPVEDVCASLPGQWPISLSGFSSSSLLARCKGDGVRVFVLDTMPDVDAQSNAIAAAAQRAGDHNALLVTIAEQMDRTQSPFIKFRYQPLPSTIENNPDYEMVAGRDINGNKYAFHMPDHGLFVMGIIRDLAPDADIEYVRVLNDFGSGDSFTLIAALNEIYMRMAPPDPVRGTPAGDLYHVPVVINLSLMLGPNESDLPSIWYGSDADQVSAQPDMQKDLLLLRSPLHVVIQNLMARGAVIVAAAGNDSHTPTVDRRVGTSYPAAFPEVISVAAVDQQGHATSYSNFPQILSRQNGIATYGGGTPTLEELKQDKVDAVRGVYSSSTYPAMVAQDPPLPDYDPHNPNGWAYWSGTSFATPIISAVAARILQAMRSNLLSTPWERLSPSSHASEVQRLLMTSSGQQEIFGQPLLQQEEFGVSVLLAGQGNTSLPAD